MCVCVPYECLVIVRSQKAASDPLELQLLELWMCLNLHVGTEYRSCARATMLLTAKPPLQPLAYFRQSQKWD